jgi:hypothetical protein
LIKILFFAKIEKFNFAFMGNKLKLNKFVSKWLILTNFIGQMLQKSRSVNGFFEEKS